jgi:hypothetical protein
MGLSSKIATYPQVGRDSRQTVLTTMVGGQQTGKFSYQEAQACTRHRSLSYVAEGILAFGAVA